ARDGPGVGGRAAGRLAVVGVGAGCRPPKPPLDGLVFGLCAGPVHGDGGDVGGGGRFRGRLGDGGAGRAALGARGGGPTDRGASGLPAVAVGAAPATRHALPPLRGSVEQASVLARLEAESKHGCLLHGWKGSGAVPPSRDRYTRGGPSSPSRHNRVVPGCKTI